MDDDRPSDPAGQTVARLRLIRRISIILCGLVLVAVIFVIAKERLSQPQNTPTASLQVKIGGPFTLTDHNGQTVTDADYRGKHTLVFFGYTYCPDICPTSLAEISAALDQLGSDAEKIVPLFVTVDPARDTAPRLKEYVAHFNPRIQGLTGTDEQIKQVAKAYRVYYAKVLEKGRPADEYLMDHSSVIYLMGPGSEFKSHFSHGTDADTMAAKLKQLL